MPFVTRKLHCPTPKKAFLFLIQECGIKQSESHRLIAKGRLSQDGVPMCNQARVIQGDFELIIFEAMTLGLDPLFVAPEFAVYDKPSGLLVHPQNRTTPYSLSDEIKYRFGSNANVAHRIDQETSGLVLASRNTESGTTLKLLFENRKITKRYLALVHGHIENELFIDEPLLREESSDTMVRMIVHVDERGKSSQTIIRPLHYFSELNMTMVEASPLTGRTHQIRVHLFHVKHPIVGDPIYGQAFEDVVKFLDKVITPEERLEKSGSSRLLLHANSLEFHYNDVRFHIISQEDFNATCFEAMGINNCSVIDS